MSSGENAETGAEGKSEKGVQPLDGLLTQMGLKNSDLVSSSSEQLTHKMVARGRKGRKLTPNVQHKILNALNAVQKQKVFSIKDLFNYESR